MEGEQFEFLQIVVIILLQYKEHPPSCIQYCFCQAPGLWQRLALDFTFAWEEEKES